MDTQKFVPAGSQGSALPGDAYQLNGAQAHTGNTKTAGAVETTAPNDGDDQEEPGHDFEVVVEPIGETAAGRLGEHEEIIGRNLVNAFVATGRALKVIREEELYKEGQFGTFDEYLRRRWKMERTYAHRLIQAAVVYENLLSIGNTDPALPLPTNEAQVRPLARLDAKAQRKAWARAVQRAGHEVPTAEVVKKVVRKLAPPNPKLAATPQASVNPGGAPAVPPAVVALDRLLKGLAGGNEVPEGDDVSDPYPGAAAELTENGHLSAGAKTPAEGQDQDTEEPGTVTAPRSHDSLESQGPVAARDSGPGPGSSDESSTENTADPLIPVAQIEQSVAMLKFGDLTGSDGQSLVAQVRHVSPLGAELLNRSAEKFPEETGRDLVTALGIANTKLQVAMRWV